MPRKKKPPRLYLDPARKTWVLRYERWFRRTGYAEHERDRAQAYLDKILEGRHPVARGFRTFKQRDRKPQPQRHGIVGFVYFIGTAAPDAPVKIGFSCSNVQKRLCELQVGSHLPLHVLATHPATFAQELGIHERLAPHRLVGEWFARAAPVEDALAAARNESLIDWLLFSFYTVHRRDDEQRIAMISNS